MISYVFDILKNGKSSGQLIVNKSLKHAKLEVKKHLEELYRKAKFKNLFYAELVGRKFKHELIHLEKYRFKLITHANLGTFKNSDFIVSVDFKSMINGTFRKLEPKLEWFEIEQKTEVHLQKVLNKIIIGLNKKLPDYNIAVGRKPTKNK